MDKKKINIKLGGVGSSTDSSDDVWRTHSMSHSAVDVKQLEDKKKRSSRSQPPPDLSDHFDIMQKFLEEKDDRKWNYFIDRLGKKDCAILKKLLCAQETSDSDSSKKRKREEKSDESTEDEGKQTKKSKWDGKNFPKKTPTPTPAPKVKQEKDDS